MACLSQTWRVKDCLSVSPVESHCRAASFPGVVGQQKANSMVIFLWGFCFKLFELLCHTGLLLVLISVFVLLCFVLIVREENWVGRWEGEIEKKIKTCRKRKQFLCACMLAS